MPRDYLLMCCSDEIETTTPTTTIVRSESVETRDAVLISARSICALADDFHLARVPHWSFWLRDSMYSTVRISPYPITSLAKGRRRFRLLGERLPPLTL